MKSYFVILLLLLCCLGSVSLPKQNDCKGPNIQVAFNNVDISFHASQYKENNITLIENAFSSSLFEMLKKEALSTIQDGESRNDAFKSIRKAGTVNAQALEQSATVKGLYTSPQFLSLLRNITNLDLERVNCNDNASMNLLVYEKPGDFIAWHTDPNHYSGNRITVLISLINESSNNTLSSSFLQYRLGHEMHSIQMKPNSILIFNGSKILHQATGISNNEKRVQLSFTYCDICKETIFGKTIKWAKETVLGY
ncbi:hypothetical protein EB118_17625 [bacterium]|nr:hypothetical protein [bacterium]NDD84232.1 hypothetical protein [bacterium]NDG31879.1 hypothetical protein [bacterium]